MKHPFPDERDDVSPFSDEGETLLQFLRHRLLITLSINTAMALLISLLLRSWYAILPTLFVAYCIGFSILGLLALLRVLVIRKLRGRKWTKLFLYFLLVAAGAFIGETVGHFFLRKLLRGVPVDLTFDWLIVVVFSIIGGTVAMIINASSVMLAQREQDLERAERAAVEAQLRALQAQIEPHFLFNTLANLDALISTDARQARDLLTNLIRYLRAALTHARSENATLQTEIELLKAYLGIMGMRLPNRLTTEFDCDPGCLRLKFPAMLLQPLVENAITHGIEPVADGGLIRISVRCADGMLQLAVDDTGIGLGNDRRLGTGAGTENVRSRLKSLFGDSARLTLEARQPRGTHAGIEIPVALLTQHGT